MGLGYSLLLINLVKNNTHGRIQKIARVVYLI
jgi:hypothetical protein